MSKQTEVTEAGFRICSSQECENEATHWYVWTNEPVMQCASCVQTMMNVASAMGHLAPVATVRLMTIAEMQPQLGLVAQREQALPTLRAFVKAYEDNASDENWNAIVQAGKRMAALQPDWIVRESVPG